MFTIKETFFDVVQLIEPEIFVDGRGFFYESYSARDFEAIRIGQRWIQDNHSRSTQGTLRGLHYQLTPGQAKLMRITAGEVLDVFVDIRRGSPTFGEWRSCLLSAENHLQLLLPPGFAHGFCCLSESADFLYKVDVYYDHGRERGIRWDDPEIGIDWPVADPIVSERDSALPLLADAEIDFTFTG